MEVHHRESVFLYVRQSHRVNNACVENTPIKFQRLNCSRYSNGGDYVNKLKLYAGNETSLTLPGATIPDTSID